VATPLRRIVAIALGLGVAILIGHGINVVAQQVHPCPIGIQCSDPAALKSALEAGQIPLIKYGLVLLGWLLAAYAGGLATIRWGHWVPGVWVMAVAFVVVIYGWLRAAPHPEWMWIGGLAGCLLFALGGGRQSVHVRAVP
jgi:hypothetical protein